uniref:hypothetical protein n=1 Tax=Klebsiella pneumoniae TaxID=573 RepID=UPI0025A11C05
PIYSQNKNSQKKLNVDKSVEMTKAVHTVGHSHALNLTFIVVMALEGTVKLSTLNSESVCHNN